MRTITVDIINDKAFKLLQDLEQLQLIRLRSEVMRPSKIDWVQKYKGAMAKQSPADIENQLNDLRSAWD